MKKLSPKLKIALITAAILAAVIYFSLPLLAEYYLEKNDTKWVGREIEVADIDLNLFTGKVGIYNGFIFEEDGTTPFINFESLELNVRMLSLLSSTFELEYVTLVKPHTRIIQDGGNFNFDDLVAAQSAGKEESTGDSTKVKFRINNIRLEGGVFEYTDEILDSKLTVDRILLTVPGISYDEPAADFNLQAFQPEGGNIDIEGNLDWNSSIYDLNVDIDEWQLRPYKNYLNSYLAILDFAGLFNADILINGGYGDNGKIAAHAITSLDEFLLVDNNKDSLLTWNHFMIEIDSVNTDSHLYDLGKSELIEPYVLFRYFEDGDSFSSLLLDTAATQTLDTVRVAETEIVFQNPFQYFAEYLYYLVDEDFFTTYGADSVKMENGRVVFHDYSHLQEASIAMDEMNLLIPEVQQNDSTLDILFSSTVNQSGILKGEMILYRTGFSNFDLDLELSNFFVTAFDPYSRYYTAHPIWEGKMRLANHSVIRNFQLESINEVFIEGIDVGKKIDMDAEYNIPLRFAVSLLKDVNGNVDIEVPVEGNLEDPDYKIGKVILKVIMNLLSKAVASPYNLLARAFDADEDDLKSIRFNNDQDSLGRDQTKTMDLTARILDRKPELRIELQYLFNAKEEKDAIALKYARQQYIRESVDSLGEDSWDRVDKRDSLFIQYLDARVGGLGQRSIEEMSIELAGSEKLDERVGYIKETQKKLVSDYMYLDKGISPERAPIIEVETDSIESGYLQPTFKVIYDVLDSSATVQNRPETPLSADSLASSGSR